MQWPPENAFSNKPSLSLSVSGTFDHGSSPTKVNSEFLDELKGSTIRAYEESGLFSSVRIDDKQADLQAEVNFIQKGSEGLAFISGFISGYTFTLIPGYAKEEDFLKTTYKDRNGKVIGQIEKEESLSFWIQFFLLFAMPFVDGPSTVIDETHFDLNRTTIEEAHKKAFFNL